MATEKVQKPLDQKEVLAIKATELHEAVAAEPTRKGSLRTFLQKLLEIINFISPDPGVRSGVKDAFDAIQKDDADVAALEANIAVEEVTSTSHPPHRGRGHAAGE